MKEITKIDLADFKSWDYSRKLEFFLLENNVDYLLFKIEDNQIVNYHQMKYRPLNEIEIEGVQIFTLIPDSHDEELIFLDFYLRNRSLIRGGNNNLNLSESLLEIDFLKSNFQIRLKSERIKEEFLHQELKMYEDIIKLNPNLINPYLEFFNLGKNNCKQGRLTLSNFWQVYNDNQIERINYYSLHAIIDFMKITLKGYNCFEYYAWLKKPSYEEPTVYPKSFSPILHLQKTNDLAVYRYYLGKLGFKREIDLNESLESIKEYKETLDSLKIKYPSMTEWKIESAYKDATSIKSFIQNDFESYHSSSQTKAFKKVIARVKKQLKIDYPEHHELIEENVKMN